MIHKAKTKIRADISTTKIAFSNFVINLLPDTWFWSRLIRPRLCRLLGLACGRKVMLRKNCFWGNLSHIRIGNRVVCNREVFFDGYDRITLGDNVSVGFQVAFITSNHEIGGPESRCGVGVGEPITIEEGVWIGARATIGPGVTIGKGCIVSTGAVVLRSVSPNSIVSGVPARVIKKLDEEVVEEQE